MAGAEANGSSSSRRGRFFGLTIPDNRIVDAPRVCRARPPTRREDVAQCHRRLLAERLAQAWDAEVVHLTRPDNQIDGGQKKLFWPP